MRNRAKTEEKFLKAVAQIVHDQGWDGLGVNKVARQAKSSKILIYRYFGSFSQLLTRYQKDEKFWSLTINKPFFFNPNVSSLKEMLDNLLHKGFDDFFFYCDREAQLMINAVISHEEARYTDMSMLSGELFHLSGEETVDKKAYLKIISKLLVVGTQQLLLQLPVVGKLRHMPDLMERREQLHQSIHRILSMSTLV